MSIHSFALLSVPSFIAPMLSPQDNWLYKLGSVLALLGLNISVGWNCLWHKRIIKKSWWVSYYTGGSVLPSIPTVSVGLQTIPLGSSQQWPSDLGSTAWAITCPHCLPDLSQVWQPIRKLLPTPPIFSLSLSLSNHMTSFSFWISFQDFQISFPGGYLHGYGAQHALSEKLQIANWSASENHFPFVLLNFPHLGDQTFS